MTKPQRTESDELRTIKRLIGAALAVAVAIGAVFYLSTTAQLNDIVQARTEARYSQCVRDNAIRHDAGEAAAKKAQDFIDANARFYHTPPATGALLQAQRDYVNSQRAVTLDAYPLRDCTREGIDAYYKNPPDVQPSEPCEPTGKGLCRTGTTAP